MVRLVCLVALVDFIAAGHVFAQQDPAMIERGQKVYTSEKCSICHSIAGKGNQKGVLDDVGTKHSADDIRQWIVNAPEMARKAKSTRKPPMKAYGHLGKDDLDALVGYLQTLKKK